MNNVDCGAVKCLVSSLLLIVTRSPAIAGDIVRPE